VKPDFASALSNRGFAFVALKEYDKATADLDAAIRLVPKLRAELGKGDVAAARADTEEAIRLDPKYAGGYEARGEVRENLGDVRGALDDFEQALVLKNGLFDAPAVPNSRPRIHAARLAELGRYLGGSVPFGFWRDDNSELVHNRPRLPNAMTLPAAFGSHYSAHASISCRRFSRTSVRR
jgi:tetratricopeptide (TPR) repeat protein